MNALVFWANIWKYVACIYFNYVLLQGLPGEYNSISYLSSKVNTCFELSAFQCDNEINVATFDQIWRYLWTTSINTFIIIFLKLYTILAMNLFVFSFLPCCFDITVQLFLIQFWFSSVFFWNSKWWIYQKFVKICIFQWRAFTIQVLMYEWAMNITTNNYFFVRFSKCDKQRK